MSSYEQPARPGQRMFPMSFAQRRLWFIDQLGPRSAAYNLHTALRFSTHVRVDVLERCLAEIVWRHEVLRTTFRMVEDEPAQVVLDRLDTPLSVTDLSTLLPDERRVLLSRVVTEEVSRLFDLECGPVLRAALVRLGPAEDIVVLVTNHIASDAWSMEILGRELHILYEAFTSGRPPSLPELSLQYADFATWQRACLTEQAVERHLVYWRRQLAMLQPIALHTDKRRPRATTFHGSRVNFSVPLAVAQPLRELCQAESATPFMVMFAVFAMVLHRYTGQEDIALGVPVSSRSQREFEDMIGVFLNTIVFRADCTGDPSFRVLVRRVRGMALEAYDHQELPFELLVADLAHDRDLSVNPLFQVGFTYDRRAQGTTESSVVDIVVDQKTSILDLTLYLLERPDGIVGQVEYSTDLFDSSTIDRLVRHLVALLTAALTDLDAPISSLNLLDSAERHRILDEWNATGTAFAGEQCVHELIQEKVQILPDAVAVETLDDSLTYAELEERSNSLARYLLAQGIGSCSLVGVCLGRSFDLVVAFLAVLKSGAAYLPLDPAYPPDRLAFMIEDSGTRLVLTSASLAARLRDRSVHLVLLDEEFDAVSACSGGALDVHVEPSALAYVMYTSGSTGRPKGVMVEHRGLSNIACAEIFRTGRTTRMLQFASISFDGSLFEIVKALCAGGTVCLAPADSLLPGPPLARVIAELGVNTAVFPPSVLLQMDPADCPTLSLISVGGEACPPELPTRWGRGRQFFNLYGPTETTIWTTAAECKSGVRLPPIGRPIANSHVYVVGADGSPVPIGVPGELLLGGVGVARGYLGRPKLTAERFIPDPFSTAEGARLYRTGDLVRWRPDGNLEFLGRADEQVKVRGQRVELGEIEAVLVEHPRVREAKVVLHGEDQAPDRPLVAYFAPDEIAATAKELREHLRRKLPEYMLPQAFVPIERLPLTPNGKLDRKELFAQYKRYRVERQVKLRDFRAHCGEVEKALLAHPGVDEAVVMALEDTPGVDRLVAYVACAGDRPPEEELRSFLAERLIASRASMAFVMLDALPHGPGGNVDHATLPEARAGEPSSSRRVAIETRTERMVAAVWTQVLGITDIGPDDDFFELGGHSLLATQVVAQMRETFGVVVPLRALFEAPTVAALASAVEGRLPVDAPAVRPEPRDPYQALPLSPAQEQMWRLVTNAEPLGLYNITACHHFAGAVNRSALLGALGLLLERHEALRTHFSDDRGRPRQHIAPRGDITVDVEVTDLASTPVRLRDHILQRIIGDENARPIDLARAPLLRARLIELGDDGAIFVASLDHLICDAASAYLLLGDLTAAYESLAAGREPGLGALRLQPADIALWERRELTDVRLAAQLDYWMDTLADMPLGPTLPFDRHPQQVAPRVVKRTFSVSPDVYSGVTSAARSSHSSVFVVSVAATATVLSRLGGRHDVVLSTTLSGRRRAELEGLIGMFSRMSRIRVDLSGDPTFREVIGRCRDSVWGMFENQDIPFMHVRKALLPDFPTSGVELLSLLPNEIGYFRVAYDRRSPGYVTVGAADWLHFRGQLHPLSVTFFDDGQTLRYDIGYKPDFYDESTIAVLAAGLEESLMAAGGARGGGRDEVAL